MLRSHVHHTSLFVVDHWRVRERVWLSVALTLSHAIPELFRSLFPPPHCFRTASRTLRHAIRALLFILGHLNVILDLEARRTRVRRYFSTVIDMYRSTAPAARLFEAVVQRKRQTASQCLESCKDILFELDETLMHFDAGLVWTTTIRRN